MDKAVDTKDRVTDRSDNSKSVVMVFKKARSDIRKLFYIQSFGQVLSLGGLIAVQMMQTSLHVEGRIGAITITSAFIVTLFVCLFVGPILMQRLKPETTLILSELGFLLFCASNFYPKLVALIPGAIFYGFGRALFVPSYSMLLIRLATHCTRYTDSRSQEYYFDQFQSKYYSINEGVQILGNGLSYVILHGAYQQPSTSSHNMSNSNISDTLYQYCGKHDCQNASIIEKSLHQYVPHSTISIYVLIMSTVLLNVLAIIIHCTTFPGVATFSHKLSKIERRVKEKKQLLFSITTNNECPKSENTDGQNWMDSNSVYAISSKSCDGKETEASEAKRVDRNGLCSYQKLLQNKGYWNTLKRTYVFLIGGRAILLGIAAVQTGMLVGFVFADATRAYASCVAGVQMTGAFAMSFGVAGMISSWIYGKVLPLFGRLPIFAVVTAGEVAIYGLCYYWEPDPNTTYVIFVIFIGLGLVNGVKRQNIIAAYTIHFARKKTIALTAFNTANIGGMGLQYGLSTFMCVSTKIVVQLTFTVLGLISYVVADFVRKYNQKRFHT